MFSSTYMHEQLLLLVYINKTPDRSRLTDMQFSSMTKAVMAQELAPNNSQMSSLWKKYLSDSITKAL